MLEYLHIAGRIVLALTFLASASGKALGRARFQAFARGIRDLRLVPADKVTLIASLVIVAELAVPALVAFPRTSLAGQLLAAALLSLFTGVIWSALRRRVDVSCPCFGFPSMRFGRRHLVRNGILLAITGAAIASWAAAPTGRPHPGGVLVAALAATVMATLIASFDDLVELAMHPSPRRRRG